MESEEQNQGLQKTTIALMIGTALFFDVLQWLMAFLFMDWVVGIFAGLTFYLWFKIHGISFMKPKRLFAFWGAGLIESIPVISTFISWIPAWTLAVIVLSLDAKAKEKIAQVVSKVPGGQIAQTALIKRSIAKQASQINQPAPLSKGGVKPVAPKARPYGNAFPKQLENWSEVTERLNNQQNKSLINSTYKGGMEQYVKDTEKQEADRIRMKTAQDKLRDTTGTYLKEDGKLNKAA